MTLRTGPLKSLMSGIRRVNQRYAKPQIEMTPFVKVSLFVLRLYLIGLVGLMVFKFLIAARG